MKCNEMKIKLLKENVRKKEEEMKLKTAQESLKICVEW